MHRPYIRLNIIADLCQEGIFRKTGNIGRQKELKERLQLNEPVDLGDGYYTAHDCASVLKSFVGDLSEPLLHEKLFNAHLHTLGEGSQKIHQLKGLGEYLPIRCIH